MLTKQQYIDLVTSLAANPEAAESLHICLPTDEREERLKETLDCFGFDPSSGRSGILEIHPLSEAKAALTRENFSVENWHYDRTSGMLLINLERGVHEHLCARLYQIYKQGASTNWLGIKETELMAEKAIDEGYCWFRSSSSYGRALKGDNVKLTAQERAVFGDMFYETI